MASSQRNLVIADLRGGMNSYDPPSSLGETQCVAAINVDWWNATLARKRAGAAVITPNWQGSPPPAFTDKIGSLFPIRYLKATSGNDSAKLPFMLTTDDDGVMGVVCSGSQRDTYAPANSSLPTAGTASQFDGAEFNGKFYLCAPSSANRLFVLELTNSGTTFDLRYSGMSVPGTPSAENSASGGTISEPRYYKICTIVKSGSTVLRRSEPSAAVYKMPSGSNGGVTVQIGTTSSYEGITHWEVYGAPVSGSGAGTYRYLAEVAIATNLYDDTIEPSTYTGNAIPQSGVNTAPVAWKYITVHGNRLLGMGCHSSASTPNQSRVWFTPVLGASDVGDSERVPPSNYIDLDENDGDYGTGLVGNFQGAIYAFKYRQVWKLVPTGDADAPLQKVCLTKEIGCVSHRTLRVGEDENGNPALYFLSHRGPMRISAYGIECVGRDLDDVWASINFAATHTSHAVYYHEKHQYWLWVPTGSSTEPDTKLVFDTALGRRTTGGVRGGWSKHTGASSASRCSCLHNVSPFASASLVARAPFCGANAGNGLILQCDTGTQDNGANYQAYVTTKPYSPGGLGVNVNVGQSHLLAKAGTSVTITQTIVADYGLESRTSTVDLTASATETRVLRQFEGSEAAGAGQVQFTIGDGAAANNTWTLDALVVPYSPQEAR